MSMELVQPSLINAAKADGLKAIAVGSELDQLQIVDDVTYQQADNLLRMVRLLKKGLEDRLNPPIKKIHDGLKELYDVRSELLQPLLDAEETAKAKMKEFKLAERKQILAAEAARQVEMERLRAQAAQKEIAEANAKTQAMRERLAGQRMALVDKANVVEATPVAAPVRAIGSSTRTITRYRVNDMRTFLRAVADGILPLDLVEVHSATIDRFCKSQTTRMNLVALGILASEEVQIVGR